jgi:hypothetical protein
VIKLAIASAWSTRLLRPGRKRRVILFQASYFMCVIDELLTSIAAKKQRLDQPRPLSPKALANLEHYYDIELTYTSNAIEGNTLSAVETTLVIEQGNITAPSAMSASSQGRKCR